MRVVIDWDLCVGSGSCLVAAPGVLRLVPFRGERRAVLTAAGDDAALLAAARACPTLALRLSDDQGRVVYPPTPG